MSCLNSSLVQSGARASIGVKACNTASVWVWISLPLVRATPASSFLLPEEGCNEDYDEFIDRPLLEK